MATDRDTVPQSHLRTLISGCHILHFHGILDAYGHLSVRHPTKPDVFVMPRNIAPATVIAESDLVEYFISDASPVIKASPAGYAERHIHSEIYKKYDSVQSVIHSHASSVIPYSISSVPLRPCFHMAGFLGSSAPVFDISSHYSQDDVHDLLVRNSRLGEALASCFSTSIPEGEISPGNVDHNVVLMRGHGFTTVGSSIEECVLRAIYTAENATIQTASFSINAAYFGGSKLATDIHYLTEDEWEPSQNMTKWSCMRPWNLWVKEVESAGLFVNEAPRMV